MNTAPTPKPARLAIQTPWSLWGMPFLMAALTTTGLVTALVSDTWGDWWAWVGLGTPVAVMAWYGLPRTTRPAGLSTAAFTLPTKASDSLLPPPHESDQNLPGASDLPNGPTR